MPEGEIWYLNSVGGFRKRKVKLDPTHPIIVRNHRDKQAHAIDERPVHSVLQPQRFESLPDLLNADAPHDPLVVSKWRIICADNAVWPLSPQSLGAEYLAAQDTDIEPGDENSAEVLKKEESRSLDDQRSLKYQEYCEEATQRAMHEAEKADNRDGYLSTLSFLFGIVACTVLILIAGVIAYYKWGHTPTDAAASIKGASLLLFLPFGLLRHKTRKDQSSDFRQPERRSRIKSQPPQKRKLAKGDSWVTAIIFDHPLLGGKIWDAQMLYSEWVKHVPETCMFRPDIPSFRKFGAIMGAAILSGILFAIGYAIGGIIISLVAIFIGLGLGAIVGWLYAPIVMGRKPIITAARLPDDNNSRRLIPIEHNYCRTVSVGEYLNNLEEVLARLNAEDADEEDAYEPTVFRATTFYADIAARDEMAEVSSPNTALQKIQIGMMALMAFGSVGLLFFIALATTK